MGFILLSFKQLAYILVEFGCLAIGKIELGGCEKALIKKSLKLWVQNIAGSEIYDSATHFIVPSILKQNICWLEISMNNLVLV